MSVRDPIAGSAFGLALSTALPSLSWTTVIQSAASADFKEHRRLECRNVELSRSRAALCIRSRGDRQLRIVEGRVRMAEKGPPLASSCRPVEAPLLWPKTRPSRRTSTGGVRWRGTALGLAQLGPLAPSGPVSAELPGEKRCGRALTGRPLRLRFHAGRGASRPGFVLGPAGRIPGGERCRPVRHARSPVAVKPG